MPKLLQVICQRCGKVRLIDGRNYNRKRKRTGGPFCQPCAASLANYRRWHFRETGADVGETIDDRLGAVRRERDP